MIQEINIADIRVERTTPVVPEDVAAMAKDIKVNGLQNLMIIDRWGLLIDGLVRLRALESLGVRKVNVDIANNIEEAAELLRKLQFDPRSLTLRRRRDFAESLDPLLRQHISANLRRRKKDKVPVESTRDIVGSVLGYPWHRIRRIFRYLEDKPQDPQRRELLFRFEDGDISINQLYRLIGSMRVVVVPPQINIARSKVVSGDITFPREQRHLLQELNRQLSGAVKGAAKLGLPINIPAEEFDQLLDQLIRNRTAISQFINALRKEAPRNE